MKILWVVNVPLPEASVLLKESINPYGGWLFQTAQLLSKKPQISLSVAFPYKKTNVYKKFKGEEIEYYSFGNTSATNLDNLLNESNPDLVHIHGTETTHALAMVEACERNKINFVISIQGLVSIIEKHMHASLPFRVIYGTTLRNFIRRDHVNGLKKRFSRLGKQEIEVIQKAKHVIGRTSWDKACVTQISPETKYYTCYETLRNAFYNIQWNIDECEKFSIFVSQAQYPIKGLHFVLEALPLILKKFPQTKLYISGRNITRKKDLKERLFLTYYGKYLGELIQKKGISDNVVFTDSLNESEMAFRMSKTHVFVSPSTIENESNSLSEAKLLGVPSVASYVGGVVDRIEHEKDGFFYQHDAPYMLAYYINQIFENDTLAISMSNEAKKKAKKINDAEKNINTLIEIYESILGKKDQLSYEN